MKVIYPTLASVIGLFCLFLVSPALYAKVPKEKAAKLGNEKYTCIGSLREGTELGVAEYTGKWFKMYPGVESEQGYPGNPYAEEEPLFVITAENMEKYAEHLTAGQKRMFAEYPDQFKMRIFPSHRDFKIPDRVCKATAYNAVHSEVVDNGLGVTGNTWGIPFPFPESGIQAIWSVNHSIRPWTTEVTYKTADVFGEGNITWGKVYFKTLAPGNNPDDHGMFQDMLVQAYFYRQIYKPARLFGRITVGFQPQNYSETGTQAWLYLPGIRRVRKAPEIGFDYPVPPNGLRTASDDYGFNGSPAHFNWKVLGKKQVYVPYNNFKINQPGLDYDKALLPNVVNPEYMRYELHRVWVIEGTRKPNIRDIYGRRVLYADEDTWLVLTADNYDNRGNLYRVSVISYFYSQASGTYNRGTSIYYDLHKEAYEATYLPPQEKADWWRINIPMDKSEFSPQAAASAGH